MWARSVVDSHETSSEANHKFMLDSLLSDSFGALLRRPERMEFPSAWFGHVPFAHWLVHATRPNCIVELGTHYGISYSAFCSAVSDAGLPSKCFAVDTWKGDEHSGHYSESVFQEFQDYNSATFGAFSTLIRNEFQQALPHFADQSIDILHIDGFHTYEAVKRDFEQWLPKMSARGVVLLHDVSEHQSDFGVWRLWEELERLYPSAVFNHSHGLGVVAVGAHPPETFLKLCSMLRGPKQDQVRSFFEVLGDRWRIEAQQILASKKAAKNVAVAVDTRAKSTLNDEKPAIRPWMSHEEVALLESFLRKTRCYFEFGSGGTTVLAAKLVDQIWSVDSDEGFLNRVRTEIGDRLAGSLNLIHADIGPTGQWGFPIGNSAKDRFDAYSLSLLKAPCEQIDLCFIDGRFRVACFLQALLALRPDAIIGIHDYPKRPQYHVIEQFARPISAIRDLCFFMPRPALDRSSLDAYLERFRRHPD